MALITAPPRARGLSAFRLRSVRHITWDVATTRRCLQLALGVLWLLDAALQFQPYMFSHAFVVDTLSPAVQGNPGWVAVPMHGLLHALGAHPALFNTGFASVQLLIAGGIVWRRTTKVALVLSIAWSLSVWWFGEGLGGVLSGASPYSGAPGAALLYAFAAVLVWPASAPAMGTSVAERSPLRRGGAGLVWLLVWGATAFLLVRLPNATPSMAHDMTAQMASGQPSWLAALEHHLADLLAGAGVLTAIALAAGAQLIGLSFFAARLRRAGVALAIAFATFLWLIQGFGGIVTGTGTDPNSSPLLALLAVSYWPLRASHRAGPAIEAMRSSNVAGPGASAGAPVSRAVPEGHNGSLKGHRSRSGWRGAVLLLFAAASLVLTGVTAGQAAAESSRSPRPMGGMKPSATASGGAVAGMDMTTGHGGSPSASARMICATETRHNVALALGLPSDPRPRSSWADDLYACDYVLPGGALALGVKQLPDDAAAQRYLQDTVRTLADAKPIDGLASLGLPGYETPDGTVEFRKDNMILEVNATALPNDVGSLHLARSNFAYQLATDILACWSGK